MFAFFGGAAEGREAHGGGDVEFFFFHCGCQSWDFGQGEEEEVIQSTEPIPANEAKAKGKQPASSLADFLSRGHALPDKPPAPSQPFPATTSTSQHQHSHEFNPSSSETVSFGGAPISKFELNALRQGVRNENGDVAYFLPSFVEEDPWAGLKAQGQDPAGVRTASGR